jgi:hypothetical protein
MKTVFGRQIAANLRRLDGHGKAICKLKIQQLLMEAELGSLDEYHQVYGSSSQYLQ